MDQDISQLNQQIEQKLAEEKKSRLPWKGILTGVAAILGVGLIAAAAFAAGMKFAGQKGNLPATVATPEAATPTPDPTAGWKEYATAWYSFKYPPEWQAVEESGVGSQESGIILVTNNLDYADFGNVKSGALIYAPVGPADEQILDTVLAENLKRGYKLVSKQPLEVNGASGTEIIMDSPLLTREEQFRFQLTNKIPSFLSLVTNPNDKDRYWQEFRLMLSTLVLLTPQNLSHFSHPDGLFQLDYPQEMKIEKTERALSSYEKVEDWEFASSSATVTLTVEPFRSRSLEDEAKKRYQKVVTENRVGAVFSTRVVSGQTAFQYIELTKEGKRRVLVYIDLPGDFILAAVYYDEVESKQAAEVMLNSLRLGAATKKPG